MLNLPKNSEQRVPAINQLIRPGIRMRNISSIEWWIIHYYMMGVRNFKGLDFERGVVKVGYESNRGTIDFKWEEVIAQFQTEIGRLMKVDISPRTDGRGLSMDSFRKAAVAQAVLNEQMIWMDPEKIKRQIIEILVKFGTVGVAVWDMQLSGVRGGSEVDIEIIPPWQLISIPGMPDLESDVQGFARIRQVPFDWLMTQPGFESLKRRRKDADLNIRAISLGESLDMVGPEGRTKGASMGINPAPMAMGKNNPETMDIVDLTEIWVSGPNETCREYIAKVGDYLPPDAQRNYEEEGVRRICPITVERYVNTGGFYGRGLMSRLIGINNEVEHMLRNVFENVKNTDQFGWLLIPSNIGINKSKLKQSSKPKYLFYQPDLTNPTIRPDVLQPANNGTFPAQMAQLGIGLQRALSSQSEIMSTGSAPGRTSAASLGFALEANSIPLTVPAMALSHGFAHIYKVMLQLAKERYREGDAIHLATIDDTVAGITFNPNTSMMEVGQNPIPDPWEITIRIKDLVPSSSEQRKQELLALLDRGLLSPTEFIIINYKENLGFPVGNKSTWEEYQKAVMENIILFRDGKTPGEVFPGTNWDNPNIQLLALQDFMSKMQFKLASVEVQKAFHLRKKVYESMLNKNSFPSQLGSMEGLAEQAVKAAQAAQGGLSEQPVQ